MSFPGGFQPGQSRFGGSDVPKTTVELSVCCSGLKDKDLMSKSDPVCVLYAQAADRKLDQWEEVDRTEKVKNSHNPQWLKKFILEYRFEERQLMKFLIVDQDSASTNISDHDFLGELQCSLGELVSAQNRGFKKPLGKSSGFISIVALEVCKSNEKIHLNISAKGLDNKDMFGKSDPYLQINRTNNGVTGPVVYRTETIDNNLNPSWKPFTIESRTLCNGDENLGLEMSVFDYDNDGSHDLIGSFHTTLKMLREAQTPQFPLINEKKRAKKKDKYKNSGILILNSIKSEKQHTFLDYVQGGTQVNFTIGIDFTASNGKPVDTNSLHYLDPSGRDNQYQLAIKSVGEIIQDYDSDRMFPSLGFGARTPPDGAVSHEFFLTLDPRNPFCAGVQGVLDAYKRCLSSVTLYGPTNFSPIIEHVAKFARAHHGSTSNYFVLLIITDGIITDMENTVRSIVSASCLPMSIIIVGVGDEDFSAMQVLDGDNRGLIDSGKAAERDIVQFVELRKYLRGGDSWSKENLAKAVLAEVPNQMLSYMNKNGLQPGRG